MKKSALFIALTLFTTILYAEEMPSDILAKVKAHIASKFPDNYSLQKTLIEAQRQDYEFLANYAPPSVPPDVLAKIKAHIASNFPDNYSLQKTLIETQVDAYIELNK